VTKRGSQLPSLVLSAESSKGRDQVKQETSAPGPRSQWWSLSRPDSGGIHIKVTEEDGRWLVTDVYVHGHGVTMADLQEVPLRQLDRIMNLSGPAGRRMSTGVTSDPALAELRKLAADAPPELPNPAPARLRLTRPDGTDPDSFYALVAGAYREYATQMRAPAVEIAGEAGVPVATARTWIREARRRGKLPEGRKGRAG
jgi:hypothetical protein